MVYSVAWLRLFTPALLLLGPLIVQARDESLFTSSVTYCAPPETLLIQQFDVAYFAKNSSIFFNISASSVESNVNVTANLQLNVYGMHPLNFTIDLCSILNGALCPLPMYNFTGVDSLPLPSSVDLSRIPGIAYKIPDLEAFAQLTLVEVGTGKLKACVQATLSNGWSTHQKAVEWSTGGLALLALVSATWQSFSPDSLAPYRLLDLIFLYQTIAATGFLNLNYPSVYRAFTLNFAWAMGLFSSSSSSLQNSIDKMRHLTGGNMADASTGSAVGLVNRKLSPYNVGSTSSSFFVSQSLFTSSEGCPETDFSAVSNYTFLNLLSSDSLESINEFQEGDVATVTQASSNVLQAGVPIYVNTIHIATANTFMTVFFVALILTAITLGALVLGYLCLLMIMKMRRETSSLIEAKYNYTYFARAWGVRLALVVYTPLLIFIFYQWTLKDSWLSVVISVITLLILGCLLYPIFVTLRLATRATPHSLFSNPQHLASYSPLYGQYRTPRYFFFILLLSATLLRALFIAFAKSQGEVQIILLLILEFFVVIAHIILKPHKTRGADVLATYISLVRLVNTGLMVAFLERIALAAIPRVVIGIIMAVIFSVSVVVMFLNILFHLGIQRLWTSRRKQQVSSQDSTDTLYKTEREKNGGPAESSDSV